MAALSTVRKNAILLVALLAANLALMSGSSGESHRATRAERLVHSLSSPFVAVADFAGGGVRSALRGIHGVLLTRSVNRQLRVTLNDLSVEAVRLREAERENRRLRQLLGMREGLALRSIVATVVTLRIDEQTKIVIVDRGEKDGVVPDLPVVAWGGAVGRVIVVGRSNSKVQLLTDANSGVAGVVQRSRAQGIVVGRAASTLDLLYVPRFSDVLHGDRVVTSGLGGIFPRGFGIGRVRSITEAADGSQTIQLDPVVDYRRLEEVLIVLEPPVAGEGSL
jgi:rod shape-determining protein MreC